MADDDLKGRINYVEDKTVKAIHDIYMLRNDFYQRETENRELLVKQENKISIVETRVNALEEEFKTQQGRLWALILVVLTEIIVAVIKIAGNGLI